MKSGEANFATAIHLTIATYIGVLASTILNLTLITVAEPKVLGTINALFLVKDYLLHLTLGQSEGLRSLFKLSGGREDIANRYFSVALNVGLLNASITCVIFFVYLWSDYTLTQHAYKYLFLIILLLESCQFLLINYLKGKGDFSSLQQSVLVNAGLTLLSIPPTYAYGVEGYLLAKVFCSFLFLLWLAKHAPVAYGLSFRIDFELFKQLFSQGFPLQLIVLVLMCIDTLPRLLVLKFFDLEILGGLAVCLYFSIPVAQASNSLATVFFARFQQESGSEFSIHEGLPFGLIYIYLSAIAGCFAVFFAVENFFSVYSEFAFGASSLFLHALLGLLYTPQLTFLQSRGFFSALIGCAFLYFFTVWVVFTITFYIWDLSFSQFCALLFALSVIWKITIRVAASQCSGRRLYIFDILRDYLFFALLLSAVYELS